MSVAFVQGIHRRPVNSPHKWPVTWKIFPFDDVIMQNMPNLVDKRLTDALAPLLGQRLWFHMPIYNLAFKI